MSSVPVYLLSSVCKKTRIVRLKPKFILTERVFPPTCCRQSRNQKGIQSVIFTIKKHFFVCAALTDPLYLIRDAISRPLFARCSSLCRCENLSSRARSVCGRASREFISLVLVCTYSQFAYHFHAFCSAIMFSRTLTPWQQQSSDSRDYEQKKNTIKARFFFALSF